MNGAGPLYHRCGPRIVYYYRDEIDAWLADCDRQAHRDQPKAGCASPWRAARKRRGIVVITGWGHIPRQGPGRRHANESPKLPRSWQPASCVSEPGSPVKYRPTSEKFRSTSSPASAVLTPILLGRIGHDRVGFGAARGVESFAHIGS